jgi:hypothetical protein
MTTPTVSVAIPLFNKASFIVDTVLSALAQTFGDFEIVVVDDGSTDGGAEKLAALSEPRLIVIRQQNAGVAAARTRAMREGQGRYVAFLDADDLWHPDHLSHLMELVRRYPDAAMFGNEYAEDLAHDAGPAGGHAPPFYRLVVDYFAECAAGRAPFYTSSCMVLRNRALQIGGFPVGNHCGEDLALWMRLAADAPVAVSDFVGCYYRRGIDSLSHNPAYRNATDVSMTALLEILEQHGDWPESRKAPVREYFVRLALAHCLDCLRAGEVNQARRYLALSADTRMMRPRLWQARLLAILPAPLREAFFRLSDLRRGRVLAR